MKKGGRRPARRHRASKTATALPPGLIAVPAGAWMWTDFVVAYQALELPAGTNRAILPGGSTIAAKRNELVRCFLEKKHLEWYLCLDSDMTPPPNTIPRLLATGHDVVGAVCTTKHPPFNVCAGYYDEKTKSVENVECPIGQIELLDFGGPQPVKEVDWTGAACLLVRRKVLEAIGDPWFEAGPSGIGEDADFCEKVLHAGFKIHVDTGLWVGHMTAMPVDLVDRASHQAMLSARENIKRNCGC